MNLNKIQCELWNWCSVHLKFITAQTHISMKQILTRINIIKLNFPRELISYFPLTDPLQSNSPTAAVCAHDARSTQLPLHFLRPEEQ